MKNTRFISVCVCLIISYACAFAAELPVLTLDEGENTIPLSIVNNWNNDLAEVTVEVDPGKLYTWLTFNGTLHVVDAHCGRNQKW